MSEEKQATKTTPNIDIAAALRIFFEKTEIGNAEIKEIFGKTSSSIVQKYKKPVLDVMHTENIYTWGRDSIDTKTAFKVWEIDVNELEKRYKKLLSLNLPRKEVSDA